MKETLKELGLRVEKFKKDGCSYEQLREFIYIGQCLRRQRITIDDSRQLMAYEKAAIKAHEEGE